jgi:hypothetical protein
LISGNHGSFSIAGRGGAGTFDALNAILLQVLSSFLRQIHQPR